MSPAGLASRSTRQDAVCGGQRCAAAEGSCDKPLHQAHALCPLPCGAGSVPSARLCPAAVQRVAMRGVLTGEEGGGRREEGGGCLVSMCPPSLARVGPQRCLLCRWLCRRRLGLHQVESNILQNVTPLRVGRSGTGMDIANAAVRRTATPTTLCVCFRGEREQPSRRGKAACLCFSNSIATKLSPTACGSLASCWPCWHR